MDLRRGSPTTGGGAALRLTAGGGEQLFIPQGFAHGFCTLETDTEVAYKVDGYYAPECDGGILWNDPALGIDWPIAQTEAMLSDKDAILRRFGISLLPSVCDMLCARRILVTGGAGFIGSAVVREIIRATPHEVLVVDKLTYAGNLDNLAPVARDPRFGFVQADIVDAPRCASSFAAFTPDVIMHLAAESHVDRSIDGPGAVHPDQRGRHLHAAAGRARALAHALGPARDRLSASTTSRRTRSLARSARTAFSPRRRRTSRTRPTRPQRLRPTTSCAPGITPTACRWCSPTARTTTAPIISPRSSSRSSS